MPDVVIGVDAHKSTHTLVAVDSLGRKLAQKTIDTTSAAHEVGIRWARSHFGSEVVWGVEDCRSVTARLERDLLAVGLRVVRVPPHLMSRARGSAREQGKSDAIDALAVARTVLREPGLPVASHNPDSMELLLLVRRRDDLVGQKTAIINRLIERVHQLDPGHVTPRNWRHPNPRRNLREWLETEDGLLAELACQELDDIDRLSDAVKAMDLRIGERVRAVAPRLLEVRGCGELTAATIVAEVADISRFKSEAAFASYIGLAPIPHSSGGRAVARRNTKRGNRQLNKALHRIAVTQIRYDGPGRTYFQRRLADGDNAHRALRSLKRRLARIVYNRLNSVQAEDHSAAQG